MSISERLKEERLRLGLNQTVFGQIGGVTKKTQMLYEGGDRMPDAAYLRGISGVGADVQYILIGLRSVNLGEAMLSEEFVQETGMERLVAAAQPVTKDEAALLDNYRHASAEGKKAIKATSDALAKPATDKGGKKSA